MAQRRVLQWLLRAALTAVGFLRTATLSSLQASTQINVKVTRGLGRLIAAVHRSGAGERCTVRLIQPRRFAQVFGPGLDRPELRPPLGLGDILV